ncbi:MAG: hypothetical protein AB1757_23175 [Acidobacteriota bacterium]
MVAHGKKSRKHSGTKLPPEEQLKNTTFFTDRSLGDHLVPDLLCQAGLKIERHIDHFEHDALDILWLEKCGEKDWVVLAKDRKIRSNNLERIALFNAGIAAFFITSANTTGKENAEAIIKALPKIVHLLQHQKKPFIARINKDGEVVLWIDHKGRDRFSSKKKP